MNTTFNKANVAVLGPWIVVLLMGLDGKFGWGFTEAWYGAAASIFIWILTYAIPNAKPAPVNPNLQAHFLLAFLLTLMVLLSGCSMLPYGPQVEAVVDQARKTAVADRKRFNDDKLELTLEAGCDVSLGAVGRMTDKVRQFYLLRHCGVDIAPPSVPTMPTLTN
jgi:hypothetical protein